MSDVAGRAVRIAALVALCLVAQRSALGAPACANTPACLQALDAAQEGLRTLDARFVQTKHVTLLEAPIVSSGRFRFKRPDKVRLDVEAPQPATILIDGRRVRIPGVPDADVAAMAATPMTAMFTELGALLGGQVRGALAEFQVHAAADGDGIAVRLNPMRPDWQRLFRSIDLTFAGQPLTVRTLRLDDALGDRLEIEMRDVRRNVELPDAVFTTP